MESVLGLRPGDDEEDTFEVLEDKTGRWLPSTTFGNDEAFIKAPCPGCESEVVWGRPNPSVYPFACVDLWHICSRSRLSYKAKTKQRDMSLRAESAWTCLTVASPAIADSSWRIHRGRRYGQRT